MVPEPTRIRFGAGPGPVDRLLLADNLDGLHTVDERSVDLCYVDPPFATGQVRRGRIGADKAPSFADQMRDPDLFVAWLRPRLERARDVLCPTGSIFVHLDHRVVHYVKVELDRVFGRSLFVNEIVWCYSVGGKSRRSFARKHDTILWYGRSADYAFYPDAVRVPRKPKSHMRVVLDEEGRRVQEKTDRRTGKVYRYPVSDGKIPEDWWTDIETLNRGDRERTGYPTQKPERLIERIVRATTVAGDRVCDFFSGSGTTGVVAQREGRRFALIDRNPDAVALASQRLVSQGHELAARGAPPADLLYSGPHQGSACAGIQPAAPDPKLPPQAP